ncbi:hypothetical protein [Nocardia altamirensis]|uniref:hypothetical protein n=1 Tax=Nocardia altamirensis TaxID=472158 RepID=UPI000840433C|nr:hypothetical protein [Nocardia altamirensis]
MTQRPRILTITDLDGDQLEITPTASGTIRFTIDDNNGNYQSVDLTPTDIDTLVSTLTGRGIRRRRTGSATRPSLFRRKK